MVDDSASADGGIGGVLDSGSVYPVFQPIVDLDTEQVAGYEALARGPLGPLHAPEALFAAGRRAGRLTELDWLCRRAAVSGARAAGVRAPLSLLVNAEPETLLADRDDPSRWGQFADLRCYCEITERAVARTPGRLAAAIDQIRGQDWGIALDDLGADPASLALLPLVQPDLIKLDASLLHIDPSRPGDPTVARVVDAALAQATATGADVIAEGIESDWHLELARAYGIRYGQGHRFGRPGPLPDTLPDPRSAMPLLPRLIDRAVDPGPFAVVASADTTVRSLTLAAVYELVRQLLAQAGTLVPAPAALIAGPDPLPETLQGLVTGLAEGPDRIPLVGVVGGVHPGLGGTPLDPHDPAVTDLAVAVVSAHFTAAVAARPSLDAPGRFDAALVLDRSVALAVATTLLKRL